MATKIEKKNCQAWWHMPVITSTQEAACYVQAIPGICYVVSQPVKNDLDCKLYHFGDCLGWVSLPSTESSFPQQRAKERLSLRQKGLFCLLRWSNHLWNGVIRSSLGGQGVMVEVDAETGVFRAWVIVLTAVRLRRVLPQLSFWSQHKWNGENPSEYTVVQNGRLIIFYYSFRFH